MKYNKIHHTPTP